MDISSIGGSALTPEIQTQYAVKCIKMAQQSDKVVDSLLQDTVEFSKEAMEKFLNEAL